MLTILLFILILGLLVVVHEFGHFITARKSGMKVFEFGFGFPPRVAGFYRDPQTKKIVWVLGNGQKKGEQTKEQKSSLANTVGGEDREEEYPATLWSLNLLPLGGFVKIKGENGESTKDSDSFGFQKAWKKVIVLAAGVTMNVILAIVILSIGFMVGLPTDLSEGVDESAIIVEQPSVVVQQVEDNSPAQTAGIEFGDKILRIGAADANWFENDKIVGEDVNSQKLIAYVTEHSEEEMSLVVDRAGENKVIQIKPEMIKNADSPKLGIALADAGVIRYPWYIAIYKGFVATFIALINIFVGFYYLIKNLILGHGLAFDVAGPVGIASLVGQSARLGFNYLLNVTAMLSLSLAAINILPIPALDGGRILFILIEKISGRPVPMKYEQLAHTIGFVLLMLLIVVVTWRDVAKLF